MADRYLDEHASWSAPKAGLDLSGIQASIAAANAAKEGVKEAEQGVWADGVTDGDRCNTPAQFEALNAAVEKADIPIKTSFTQDTINALDGGLKSETNVFTTNIFAYRWTPSENIANASWHEIDAIANLAAADPENYTKYLGQEKTLTIGGNTVTARIVEVGKQKLANGGVCGFVFNPYRGMTSHKMNSNGENSGGYTQCQLKTWIEGLTFDPEVAPALQTMEFVDHCFPNKQLQAKFALMSDINVFGSGQYCYEDEGERYRYFIQNDTNEARVQYDTNGSKSEAWLLTKHTGYFCFRTISKEGSYGYQNADITGIIPAARFCLGSSV